MSIYFVSGIDTACGKTYATGILAKRAMSAGKRVITQKFVQTGCDGISEDIAEHRRLMGVPLFEEDKNGATCPYVFKFPASPHLAARMEDVAIDLSEIADATRKLSEKFDEVFIEGAGGLMVPLCEDFLTIDYIVQENLPLILVVSSKLGSINHALLSIDVCATRGINLVKIAYNDYPKTDVHISEETRNYVKRYAENFYPACEFEEI